MNILVISSTFPYPPSRGGTEIRTFHLLRCLRLHHRVTLATQRSHTDISNAVKDEALAALEQWVDRVIVFPLPAAPPPAPTWKRISQVVQRSLTSLVRLTPQNVLFRYSPELQAWLDDALQANEFDVVICAHSVNEIYIRSAHSTAIATLVDIHSSVYGWMRDQVHSRSSTHWLRDRLYLPLLYLYERRYCTKFSHLVVTTDDDRTTLQSLCPNAAIAVIPNGVDLEAFPMRPRDPNGHRLVFVGAMDASHNVDAVLFFAEQVLPRLMQRYPDVIFTVVGARPVAAVQQLSQQPGIQITGAVETVVPYLHAATVCVVPLRMGYGIKNKTLEAMAAGVPVVGSDRGLEGLPIDNPNEPLKALRANRPEEYINAIQHLFEQPDLRQQISTQGRVLVEQNYTWKQFGKAYEQVLRRVSKT